MKIGVVGAGISGLAISLAAEKAGHEVVIFESESDIGGGKCPLLYVSALT